MLDNKEIANSIAEQLESSTALLLSEPPRKHLGASIIGDDCAAKLWASFRWLKQENFTGQQRRLFNRGHKEEPRFIEWLRSTGLFEIYEHDPATQQQFRIIGAKGHFGGSLDGLAKAPTWFGDEVVLLEFKTHGQTSYDKLVKYGMRSSKPMHFKQMSCYGRAYGLKRGLYMAVNKNKDELHIEVVDLDWQIADDLFRRAENIIFSKEMPAKIAKTATFSACKYCHFTNICHKGEKPEKNCRSCRYSMPVDDGKWSCVYDPNFHCELDSETIANGCSHWSPIVNA